MRVAQLDRASGYGPEGRGFESSRARDKDQAKGLVLFLVCAYAHARTQTFFIANLISQGKISHGCTVCDKKSRYYLLH